MVSTLWRTRSHELILILVIILFAWLRFGLVAVPLERDEGEYAYAGQLILQGLPPYQDVYTMKLPGVHLMYAGIMALFGQTHQGIHIGLILINAVVIITLFLLGRKLVGPLAGLTAAGVFAVLACGQAIQGIFANAEHFVILFAVPGFLLLHKALDENRPLLLGLSALLLGTCILMKQHGALFPAFGLIYGAARVVLKRNNHTLKQGLFQVTLFGFMAAIPFGITCLIFFSLGIFDAFWLWTFEYARAYATSIPLSVAWLGLKSAVTGIVKDAPLIWLLVIGGAACLLSKTASRSSRLFIAGFALASFLATVPGFYFRFHYFILVLPAASLLAGLAVHGFSRSRLIGRVVNKHHLLASVFVVTVIVVTLLSSREFLFSMTLHEVSRSTYGLNPFPESLEIARFIQEHTTEHDRIAVIGSEPQILFYARRRSATGHIYMYPLMESHAFALSMQEEMIREIEAAEPTVLVYVNVDVSWLMRPDSHRHLFQWLNHYGSTHYTPVGLVRIMREETVYEWAPPVRIPQDTRTWILVLQRREMR